MNSARHLLCRSVGDSTVIDVDPSATTGAASMPPGESGSGSVLVSPGRETQPTGVLGSSAAAGSITMSSALDTEPQGDPSMGENSESSSATVSSVAVDPLPSAEPSELQRSTTRLQRGIQKPKIRTDGTVRWCMNTQITAEEPATLTEALIDKNWANAR